MFYVLMFFFFACAVLFGWAFYEIEIRDKKLNNMAVSCEIQPIDNLECLNVRKQSINIKVDENGNAFDENNNYLGVATGHTILATGETFWTIEQDDNIFKPPVNNSKKTVKWKTTKRN